MAESLLGEPQAGARLPLPLRHPGRGPRAIIAWINHYNAVRLHSSLGNVPPLEWELRFAHQRLHAAFVPLLTPDF